MKPAWVLSGSKRLSDSASLAERHAQLLPVDLCGKKTPQGLPSTDRLHSRARNSKGAWQLRMTAVPRGLGNVKVFRDTIPGGALVACQSLSARCRAERIQAVCRFQ